MGLFSRKKKEKQTFDPRKQYVPVVEYNDDLSTTLVNRVGIGSRDSKRVRVEYEDEALSFYINSGVLRGVLSETQGMEIGQRFYWVDHTSTDPTVLEEIGQIAQNNDVFVLRKIVKDKYSDYLPLIDEFLFSYSLELLVANHEKKIKSVRLDLMDGDDGKKVKEFEVMDIPLTELGKRIEKETQNVQEYLHAITNSEMDITTLDLGSNEFVPQSDVQRFVYAAAESNSSLADVSKLSQGFLWSEILECINELSFKNKLVIVDPADEIINENDEGDLPDLDLLVEESLEDAEGTDLPDLDLGTETSDELPNFEEQEESPFGEEEWGYSAPPVVAHDAPEDDGGFAYEEDIDKLTMTQHVLDDFDFDVKLAVAREECSREFIIRISSLLRKNRELEEKTAELDKSISPLQTDYDNKFAKFQYVSTTQTLDDDSEVSGDDLEEIRKKSNLSFQELYDYEEARYKIGNDRKLILEEMEKTLHDLPGSETQSLIYRVSEKIEAIDNAVNLAYHTPKDDEHLIVDPEFLTAIEPTPEETPMFQKLMKDFGDPFRTIAK